MNKIGTFRQIVLTGIAAAILVTLALPLLLLLAAAIVLVTDATWAKARIAEIRDLSRDLWHRFVLRKPVPENPNSADSQPDSSEKGVESPG